MLSLSPSANAAPLSTILSNRFGHRLVVMAGGILVSAGMITASFAHSVVEMYITIGVISGKLAPLAKASSKCNFNKSCFSLS